MIPILSAEQIRATDKYTIENEPISSINLMERASSRCFEFIKKKFPKQLSFLFFCGQGNNGGDGLAIARYMHENDYTVKIIILKTRPQGTPDFETNFEKIRQLQIQYEILEQLPSNYHMFNDFDVIVDCIFGSGLNKPTEGFYSKIIEMINESEKYIISIDIPSGLFADGPNKHSTTANTILADETLTFECPKLSFLLNDSGKFVNNFHIIDIGLDKKFINSLPVNYFYITDKDIINYLKPRKKFTHKGNYGHILIIAGSNDKTGAAILAGNGCLSSGAGLVTIHCPSKSTSAVHAFIPEAMVSIDLNQTHLSNLPDLVLFDAIAVGPGIGTHPETINMLKKLITNVKKPIILDADALNILAINKTWISQLPLYSILTPHPKEFDRMFGTSTTAYDRLQKQIEYSVNYSLYIVLKGAHTSISTPDGKVYFNSTGTPAMAKGGSGDVLTGIMAAFLAQLKSPLPACITSVFLHGLAAEIAEKEFGTESMLPRHIAQNMGKAFSVVRNATNKNFANYGYQKSD